MKLFFDGTRSLELHPDTKEQEDEIVAILRRGEVADFNFMKTGQRRIVRFDKVFAVEIDGSYEADQ